MVKFMFMLIISGKHRLIRASFVKSLHVGLHKICQLDLCIRLQIDFIGDFECELLLVHH